MPALNKLLLTGLQANTHEHDHAHITLVNMYELMLPTGMTDCFQPPLICVAAPESPNIIHTHMCTLIRK